MFGGLGWAMNRDEVKAKVLQYLTEVIEKPRQEFGGMPVCPFAKKERKAGKLLIDVFDSDVDSIAVKFQEFAESDYDSALFAQLSNEPLGEEETRKYQAFLNKLLKFIGLKHLKTICFNPNFSLDINGFNPRSQAPFFLINVADRRELAEAHNSILKTTYFDNMSDEYLKYLKVKE